MKKLILSASALMLSLGLASAQTQGWGSTHIYDDFANTGYSNEDGTGIYWYSYPEATTASGTRNTTAKTSTFSFSSAPAYCDISANFGSSEGVKTPINLTTMADVEVIMENGSSTKDLVMRVYLEDINGKKLFVEPNISDVTPTADWGDVSEDAAWTSGNLVYPKTSADDPAVYPRIALNGFVLEKGTTQTIRIDLSSVAGTLGGRFTATDFSQFGSTPATSPSSQTAPAAGFDITQVHVVHFQFNESTTLTLSGSAQDKSSYLYDAVDVPAQDDFADNIIFHSLKIGSILDDLPFPTAIRTDAAVDGSLNVYPNPAKDQLKVAFETADNATISLSNIVGNEVYSTPAVEGVNVINVASYPKGIYLLTVTTEKGKASRRVSIQ